LSFSLVLFIPLNPEEPNYISSFAIKKQSKQLLEIAKTGVEKAIETNEEVAIDWINQQLKNLEIKNSPPFLRGAGGDQPC